MWWDFFIIFVWASYYTDFLREENDFVILNSNVNFKEGASFLFPPTYD